MKEKFEKFKRVCKRHASKLCSAVAGGVVMVSGAVSAFAAEGEDNAAAGVQAAKDMMKIVTAEINIGNIIAIIGAGLGIAAATWLAWWGIRKLITVIKNAIAKGKLSV